MKIKEISQQQRPREKALRYGLESLSDLELVALILQSGSHDRSVFDIASDVLKQSEDLANLMHMHVNELMQIKGIREVKALQLLSCIELSKRTMKANVYQCQIHDASDVVEWFKIEFGTLSQEHFVVLYLDTKNKLIGHRTLFVGTLNESIVHPREIFKEAFILSACSVMIVHNHPSGDPDPSDADIMFTNRLFNVALMMGVNFLDHVIVGSKEHYSFKQHGYLD